MSRQDPALPVLAILDIAEAAVAKAVDRTRRRRDISEGLRNRQIRELDRLRANVVNTRDQIGGPT